MANMNVTYQEMHDAAKHLTDGKNEIDQKLCNMLKLVSDLTASGYVTDASSKAFKESYDEFNKGVTKVMDGLNGMSQFLTQAATALHDTDTQLAKGMKH